MEPAPAPVPSKSVWTLLKAIPWLTLLGAGATLAFLILCRCDNTVIRWQLMLPLAAVGEMCPDRWRQTAKGDLLQAVGQARFEVSAMYTLGSAREMFIPQRPQAILRESW